MKDGPLWLIPRSGPLLSFPYDILERGGSQLLTKLSSPNSFAACWAVGVQEEVADSHAAASATLALSQVAWTRYCDHSRIGGPYSFCFSPRWPPALPPLLLPSSPLLLSNTSLQQKLAHLTLRTRVCASTSALSMLALLERAPHPSLSICSSIFLSASSVQAISILALTPPVFSPSSPPLCHPAQAISILARPGWPS